jgi:hypothetical protein
MADQSMRCRIKPIRLPADRAGWQAIGKVIRVGANIGQIVGRPRASVQIVLLDRDIDLGAIVQAALVLGHVVATDDARNDYRRQDPEDRYDSEQFHERERNSILLTAVHCRAQCTTCPEGSARRHADKRCKISFSKHTSRIVRRGRCRNGYSELSEYSLCTPVARSRWEHFAIAASYPAYSF